MPGPAWTDAELVSLREQIRGGRLPEEVELAGRSLNSIRAKASRLKLIGDGIRRKDWSEEELAQLKECINAGWKPRDFDEAKRTGIPVLQSRNRNSIQKQIQRLGIAKNKKLSRAQRKAVRFTEEKQCELAEFLTAHYRTKTPEEMMKLWNSEREPRVGLSRIRSKLVALRIKLPRAEITAMPYSKKKFKKARKSKASKAAARRRSENYWNTMEREHQALHEQLAARALESGKPLDERLCTMVVDGTELGCGKRRPFQPPFFHFWRKKNKSGSARYGSHLCAVCRGRRNAARNRRI